MDLVENISSLVNGGAEPVGTVYVVDPSPLNWLYITYNTVEEPVRVDHDGKVEPAAMESYEWVDDLTLEVAVRRDNRFADGEAVTAHSFKRSFDELIQWQSPHPPGTQFNHPPETRCEVVDDYTVRFHLPTVDGLTLGKLRAMHVMSSRFWDEIGFGYRRNGTGEGRW